jgi:hypothetical protein
VQKERDPENKSEHTMEPQRNLTNFNMCTKRFGVAVWGITTKETVRILNVAVESPERIAHLADEAIMEC